MSDEIENNAEPSEREQGSSYAQIVSSSAMLGFSQGGAYVVGMMRVKFAALLLGTTGVALIGIFNSILAFAATMSAMGLKNSAVREIAIIREEGDAYSLRVIQVSVQRLALVLGCVGAFVLSVSAPIVSQLVLQDMQYTLAVAILSSALIFYCLNIAQRSLLQGHRKVKRLAITSLIAATISSIIAVVFYLLFGINGIIPSLVAVAAINLLTSWISARRLVVPGARVSWSDSLHYWGGLLAVGGAVAWGEVLAQFVPLFAKSLIAKEMGLEVAGYYVAAWAISGMLAGFILGAMSADYYPRLSAAKHDMAKVNRIVNEQSEVAVLLLLPVILFAVAFANPLICLLYSAEFDLSADLLPWLLLGVFGKVVDFPMSMIVLAKGDSKTFAGIQTVFVCLHIAWVYFLYQLLGVEGVAMGFAVHCWVRNGALTIFLRLRYAFIRDAPSIRILLISASLFVISFLLRMSNLSIELYYGISITVALFASLFCLRELFTRLHSHRTVIRIVGLMPRWLASRVS